MTDLVKRSFLKHVGFFTLFTSTCSIINKKIILKEKDYYFINEKFNAMGTNGNIKIFSKDLEEAENIAENAIKIMLDIEKLASKFYPYAEIAELNRNFNKFMNLSDETIDLLEIGIKYKELTNGYFDIGLGNILTIAGIDNIPINGSLIKENDFIKNIIIIKKNKVKIIRPNTTIDLGGIAKGYAIDKAMDFLKKKKIEHAAIELGGDIRVHNGMPGNKSWKIIFDEKAQVISDLNTINLKNGSIAVSGGYLKKSTTNSRFRNHIINPKKIESKNNNKLSLVLGECSTVCDILATSVYNMKNNEEEKLKNIFTNYTINTYDKNKKSKKII